MAKNTRVTADAIGPNPSNDGEFYIEGATPYVARVMIEGTSPILFHKWSNEDVAAKSAAAKNSKTKKSDNVESYVYRDERSYICLPGEYLRQSVINAAKFRQDPRSPRKSAMDLYTAAVISLTELARIERAGKASKVWDYLDSRRVRVQRTAITRVRPAFLAGWQAEIEFQVLLPEYIIPADLLDVLGQAGRLVGVADNRPTYGRFQVVKFETSGM